MGRQGVRCGWDAVPATVRAGVDDMLGARVVATRTVEGGFSPGPAVRAELDDGRTVFLKAAGLELNRHTPGMHRREAHVLAVLPPAVPAPRLLGVVDDGDWVVLAVEWIVGRMPDPTDASDVERLLDLVGRLSRAGDGVRLDGVGAIAEVHPDLMGHWIRLTTAPLPGLDDWSRRHLDRLAELDARVPEAVVGSCLVHVDLRTDNVVFAAAGASSDVVVDWPGAAIGAPWVDLVGMLPALRLDGGPEPEDVFAAHPVGAAAPPTAVDAFVVGIAGYLTRQSLLPAPPGLPTVRAFQAAQGAITRHWVAVRLGLR